MVYPVIWPEDPTRDSKVEVIDVQSGAKDADILDRINCLKEDDKLSTIDFHAPHEGVPKTVIDSLVGLLKSNHSIRTLLYYDTREEPNRKYLLKTLADSHAGDNLDSLAVWWHLNSTDVGNLGSYLRGNRNLQRLDICVNGPVEQHKFFEILADSTVAHLSLDLQNLDAADERVGEIVARFRQCNSISSLRIAFSSTKYDATAAFVVMDGIAKMPCLKRLDIILEGRLPMSPLIIDAIGKIVVQREETLEHFGINTPKVDFSVCTKDLWALGLALGTAKSVSVDIDTDWQWYLPVLSQLRSCESLGINVTWLGAKLESVGSVISSLPKLRTVILEIDRKLQEGFTNDLLNMIMASSSITTLVLKGSHTIPITHEVSAFCLLNKEFSAGSTCFSSNDLWIRMLSKIRNGGVARATFVYRLLRDRPDLIVGRMGFDTGRVATFQQASET